MEDTQKEKDKNDISYDIIGAIYNVYNALGPGLLESVYEEALIYELELKGLSVRSQVEIPIAYKGKMLSSKLRADLIVENKVIVELKSVKHLDDLFYKQLLTYLRLTGISVGLLVNFNTSNIREDIRRIANKA